MTALAPVGCQPRQVDYGSLETRRSDGVVTFQDEPFDGVAVRYDDLGFLVERTTYRMGRKDGLAERWHAGGMPGFRATYRGGRRHGRAETWWEDGMVRSVSHYVDGVAHGVQRDWYRSGALFKEVRLVNGREEGIQRAWRENGKLYANYEARDGRTWGMKRSNLCLEQTRTALPGEREPRPLPYYADESFAPLWYEDHSDLPDGFHSIGSFQPVEQRGAAVTEATVRGKVYVANFFFTACPGICPMTMASMARLQSELGGFDDVLLISHSVTPEADTVPVLQAYAERMRVVSSKWHLVTGSREVIDDLGKRAYFAHEDLGEPAGNTAADTFLHSEHFLLVDRDGHIRGVYNGMNRTAVEQLIGDVEVLRREAL